VLQKRGLPAGDNGESHKDLMALGGLTMMITVFLSLVGQGCQPREALTVTVGLGLGGAEVMRQLRRDGGRR
jgi:hypothetical protein